MTEDLALADSGPDGTRSRSSARPLERLMSKGERNLERLDRRRHLGKIEILAPVGEKSGIAGVCEPVSCMFAGT